MVFVKLLKVTNIEVQVGLMFFYARYRVLIRRIHNIIPHEFSRGSLGENTYFS